MQMALEARSPGILRFGTFEVELRSGELRKKGVRLKLQDQPFQVLKLLLHRSGELVTREELRTEIWSADTFVDFDNGLNTSINKLREALGDSADSPRFIETLPRRGYRFIAPVTADGREFVPTGAGVSGAKPGRNWKKIVIVVVIIVGGVCAGGMVWRSRQSRKPTEKDTIVLADFVNTTGDPVFDGTLRQGLMAELEQSPYLNILSDEQIADALRLMSQPPGTRFTHELARHVCQRTGRTVMLDGSIAQIGSQYQLILNTFDCSTGALLASAQAVASDKNHVLGAFASAASSIRAKLGESLASIQKFNTPLEEVTTPSIEALRAYTLGWQAHLNGDSSAAVGPFERAISLDPNFAMAYAALGTAYGALGEPDLAAADTQKAYDLRDRVSEREKFYISSHYEEQGPGDLEKAIQVLKLWAQTYPRDLVPVEHLSWDYASLGRFDESLTAARRAIELAPDRLPSYEVLASSYLNLDRLDEAAVILQQAKTRGIDSPSLHELDWELAFLKGDAAEMAREEAWAAGQLETKDLLTGYQLGTAVYAGHFAQANDLTARAVASARGSGEKERAAGYLAQAALREALVGNFAEARLRASAALQVSDKVAAGLALALAGDLAQAQKFAADESKRYPQDTPVQFIFLPTIRAGIALGQRSPAKAIADLQTVENVGNFSLYPVYLRGEAYLAAHKGSEAAGEFQKIIDHRGIVGTSPFGALAHLGLARSYFMQGDTAKARSAYQDFFTLWKDADPDLPILQQAKAEFARLR
jgi:DNA-binding winged helix-turn-helix (wHTH) protein/tetratricopeptide (TPR) repeat protein